MKEKEEFPSLSEQGKNLAKFTFEVVKSGITIAPTTSTKSVFVSEEKQKERLDICKMCEYYSLRQNRCRQCGCYMNAKVKFTASQCPIQKW
jgi:hypothetical protein